jgi:hypothetical protein
MRNGVIRLILQNINSVDIGVEELSDPLKNPKQDKNIKIN